MATYNGIVSANGSGRRRHRVCCTKQSFGRRSAFPSEDVTVRRLTAASLHGLTTLPNHGTNWPAEHIYRIECELVDKKVYELG